MSFRRMTSAPPSTRLIAPAEMGILFKVLAITDDRISHLAGFETDS